MRKFERRKRRKSKPKNGNHALAVVRDMSYNLDSWYLLAAAVARGVNEPEERRRWREWAIDHWGTPTPTAATRGRRTSFVDVFNERRNVRRWEKVSRENKNDTDAG